MRFAIGLFPNRRAHVIKPGSRQKVAAIIAQHVEALLRPSPVIPPMSSPMQDGWSMKRQAS